MTRRAVRELREIVEDAEEAARGLSLAYHRHAMPAATYTASLAALYMSAVRRVSVVVARVES
jgi:hypothetical protein